MEKFILKIMTAAFVLISYNATGQEACSQQDPSTQKAYFPLDASEMKEKFPQIRESLPTLREFGDKQIMRIMNSMGSDYYWEYETANEQASEGILILAHGVNDFADQILFNDVEPLTQNYTTSIAFGMSMMTSKHISCALVQMQEKDLDVIHVIPLTESPYNTLIRQWRYAFGLEPTYTYADIEIIDNAKINFLEPINDHVYAREIVYEHAMEISKDPQQETVIIVAHGPIDAADNAKQLQIMQNIAEHIQDKGNFHSVLPLSLQDDADPDTRSENVMRFRDLVEKNSTQGRRTLVVTDLMSSEGIQSRIKKDLDGLEYAFNEKGIVSHPLFIEWVKDTARGLK
jgi:hypothetical protein